MSLAFAGSSTPIRRIPSACCARTASGHAAAPPKTPRKSRRLMLPPWLWTKHSYGSNEHFDRGLNRHQNDCRSAQPMSLLGHSRPSFSAQVPANVRYAPESDHSRYEPELTLSAISDHLQCKKSRAFLGRKPVSQCGSTFWVR